MVIENNTAEYAVYVGRLSEEKGVKTLINAWSKVIDLPLKIRTKELNVFICFLCNWGCIHWASI